MGQVLIRNLDDAVIDELKRRAARRQTSLEEEIRQTLTAAAGPDRAVLLARMEKFRKEIGPLPGPTSVEILRRDRRRDEA